MMFLVMRLLRSFISESSLELSEGRTAMVSMVAPNLWIGCALFHVLAGATKRYPSRHRVSMKRALLAGSSRARHSWATAVLMQRSNST